MMKFYVFEKSSSKFVGDNPNLLNEAMGLHSSVGPIFGWFDNFDLLVSTPNGRRETHVMAHEFQMNPNYMLVNSSAKLGVINLVVPRLLRSAAQSKEYTKSITLHHYPGPKKVNPPAILTTLGIPYTDICNRQRSLESAQKKDTDWLISLFCGTEHMDWHGYNNQHTRHQNLSRPKPATVYLLGHLIDSPPSHPDKIFTSMLYISKSLKDLGMTF